MRRAAANLGALVSMCSANPGCEQSQPDDNGQITFRIRQQNALLRLACSADGACLRVEPKSPRVSIVNAALLMAFR